MPKIFAILGFVPSLAPHEGWRLDESATGSSVVLKDFCWLDLRKNDVVCSTTKAYIHVCFEMLDPPG